jgi:hypothetical protein
MISSWMHVPDDPVVLPAATNDYLFGTTTLPEGWTLTREAAALGRGSNGRWVSHAVNVPRPFHDPVTLANRGILVEPSRTQLIYGSRPVVVTALAATLTIDTVTQTPLGVGGRLLVEDTTNTSHGFNLFFGNATRAAALADNSTVSLQLVFKPLAGLTRAVIFAQLKTSVYQTCVFSFPAVGEPSIVSHDMVAAKITRDTDGHFRLEFTVNYGTGTTGGAAHLSFQREDGTRFYTGDGARGMLLAYYGAELGTECTSPIITTGTSITRPEDVLTSTNSWLKSGAKTIGIEYTSMGADTDTVFHATGTDSIEITNATNSISAIISSAGSFVTLQGAAAAAGVERTTILTMGFEAAWLAEEGNKLAFSEAVPPPTALDSVRVGARIGGGFPGPMTLKRIKYWDRSLDREVAAAYSADISIPGVEIILPVIDVQTTITVPADQNILNLAVTLEGEPTGASVGYRTINGTAISGVDYAAAIGVLEFSPGENIKQITISLGVRSLEQTKAFSIELTAPTGATLGNAVCVVTLTKAAPAAHAPLKLVNFTGTLSADWTFTRSTPGYSLNSNGVWTSVAANQPRIYHRSADDIGILLEPTTTQCVYDSAHFGYTANSTRTPLTNGTTPTGARYMQWRETAVLGNHLMRGAWNTTAATWPTADFCFWLYLKPVGPRVRWRLSVKGIDGVYKVAIFTLSGEGSVVSTSAADVIAMLETVPYWPGWYRVGLARPQALTANVSAEFDIGPIDEVTNSNQLEGNTAYGLDICHLQVEPGLLWTSPILANAATAVTTRGIDILKAAGGWQNRNSFSLGVKFRRLSHIPATQRVVQFRDASPSVDDYGLLVVDGALRAPLTTNGTFHANINGPATTLGVYTTAIVSIDTDRYVLFASGVKVGEISMIGKTMPEVVEHLRFGSKEQDGSQAAPIVIQTAAYWIGGMSDDEGIVFSADLTGTLPGGEPGALPVVSIPAALDVAEGASIAVPITKTGTGACSVNFRTAAATASFGVDYTGIGNPDPTNINARIVSFAANETSKTVTVQTTADTVTDPDEKFGIHISLVNTNPPDCQLGNAAGEVTILETPTVAIQAAVNATEGSPATISVVKSGIGACSVTYRTSAQTATLNSDYTGINATVLSFGANETTKTITVQTLTDAVTENTNETFKVILENPTGCKLGTTTSCTVTIVDPTGTPPPTGGIYDAPVGFATTVDAGIGQTPYYVTSLANTSTTGTLRHALSQSNRCVVFEVGGRWVMDQAGVNVTGSNLTICGETAPAPGIIIQGGDFKIGAVQNVHFRHITFERGHDDRVVCDTNGDAILLTSTNSTTWCENIWFDHCAMLWSNDEVVSLWPSRTGLIRNISFTNCLFAEPLRHPEIVAKPGGGYYRGHHEGTLSSGACRTEYGHNYGVIIGYRTGNVDIQYSAFVDCGNRAPFIDGNTRVVVANVLALNCSQGAWVSMNTYEDPVKASKTTVAGYLAISGNDSGAYQIVRIHTNSTSLKTLPAGTALWAKGLYAWKGVGAPNTPSTKIGTVYSTQESAILNPDTNPRPIDIPNAPVPILTAEEIYQRTKDNVGPRPKDRANGPASVTKVVRKIELKASKYVNMPQEVGGMSTLPTRTRSLRAQGDANPPKFADGVTVIPAFPSPSTDKAKVRAWLRRFLDDVQYD